MSRRFLLIITILYLAVYSLSAQRLSSYQSGAYYPGLMSLRDLAAPPSGFLVVDYNYFLSSNGYFDGNGERFRGGTVDILNSNPLEAEIDPTISGYINAPVFYYTSVFTLLGGARYMASFNPLYINIDSRAFLAVGNESGTVSSNTSGLGDISFMPLGLSWSFNGQLDLSFLYTTYVPTGRYESGSDDNLGQGFWTHQIQTPTYFYLNEQSTAIVLIPTLEINGKVVDAEARMGNRLSIEYGFSQYLNSWLELEVMNGHNWQIGNDTGSDVWWNDTRFGGLDSKNVFAAGINIWPIQGVLSLRMKYLSDYGARYRFKNEIWSFSLLVIPKLKPIE